MTGEGKENLNIVFIGNSITQGALLENPRHEASVKAAFVCAGSRLSELSGHSTRG